MTNLQTPDPATAVAVAREAFSEGRPAVDAVVEWQQARDRLAADQADGLADKVAQAMADLADARSDTPGEHRIDGDPAIWEAEALARLREQDWPTDPADVEFRAEMEERLEAATSTAPCDREWICHCGPQVPADKRCVTDQRR